MDSKIDLKVDLKVDDAHIRTFRETCDEFLPLILYLGQSPSEGPQHILYERIKSLFNSMEEKARKSMVMDADLQNVRYALTALIDHTIGWESRLEQEFFKGNVAGEEFFNRLDKVKQAKGWNGILEVYYLCLAMGFEGKYFRNPGRLQEYIKELNQILGSGVAETLSPHGEIPQESIKRKLTSIPSWLPYVFMGLGVVIVELFVILLKSHIIVLADSVVRGIREMMGIY